jgi:hypothetical protein
MADIDPASHTHENLSAGRVVTPSGAPAVPPRPIAVLRGADDPSALPELAVNRPSDLGLGRPLPILERPKERRESDHDGCHRDQGHELAHTD